MSNDNPPPSGSQISPSDEMAQYVQVYIDESEEELEGLVEAILLLEGNPRHEESLNKAFRMLHSLKGSSGMLGFEVVGNFAHELEERFERYRSGQATLNRETTTLILKCVDYLRSFLGRLKSSDFNEGDPSALLEQLQALEQSRSLVSSAASTTPSMPAMTISGGIRLQIRFRSGLQLADLKARLIVSRLSAIGDIVACEPAIDDAASFDELSLFSLTLVTDRKIEEVSKIANVDGVESIEIEGGPASSNPVVESPAAVPKQPASVVTPQTAKPQGVPETKTSTPQVREKTAEPESSENKTSSETLRVDIGRLDHLMNLTGELVVANARFGQITGNMSPIFRQSGHFKKAKELADRLRERFVRIRDQAIDASREEDQVPRLLQELEDDLDGLERQADLLLEGHRHFGELSEAVDQLTRVSKNLQRAVLDTRMVPVGPLFNRFKRVIRDLSVERQKKVQLVIQGEKTELDKRMIDALGDPLLHLVRNSIDHGLESIDRRRAVGKPEVGTIVLEAAHHGNNVWITVRDDGAGINLDKIRNRAVERGLASASQVQELPDAQVIAFIWHPGFSTADAVSEISGRGVGMDIVQNAISNLSGTIDVSSTPGSGTTFTIRLPLTLAIIHSLMMRYREGYFSIPIDDVREIVSINRDQVHSIHRHVTIDVRGELIPLFSMKGVFHWAGDGTGRNPLAPSGANELINVVIIHTRGKTFGLAVDSLVGRGDLVIKSLSENFQPVRGLSGASILGDGAVCLMLDSAALLELASERPQSTSTA